MLIAIMLLVDEEKVAVWDEEDGIYGIMVSFMTFNKRAVFFISNDLLWIVY